MNTPTASIAQQQSDWLRYFIKRLPPDEALLKALEYRYFDLLDVPQPCLDLRDGGLHALTETSDLVANRYASVILSASKQTKPLAEDDLRTLNRSLQLQGMLALTVGSYQLSADNSIIAWATRLMNMGFAIERWQTFFPITAYDQLRRQRSPFYQWAYDLTGHYVLTPWDNAQANLLTQLHEIYTQTAYTDGAFMLIVARKESHNAIDAKLPSANPFTLAELTQISEKIVNRPDGASSVSDPPLASDAISAEAHWFEQAAVSTDSDADAIPNISPYEYPTTDSTPFTKPTALTQNERNGQWDSAIDRFSIETGAIVAVSVAAVLGAAFLANGGWFAMLLWVVGSVGACAAVYTFIPDGSAEPTEQLEYAPQSVTKYELLILLGILVFGLGLRLINLNRYPSILAEIEAMTGLSALRVLDGVLTTPFAPSAMTGSALADYLFSVPVQIFGRNTFSIRFLPAIMGMTTIAIAWIIGRGLWNRTVGLVAALLLAGVGFHIHVSRMGAIYVVEALIAFAAMGAIGVAWHNGQRRWWLAAGVCSGLSMYFATTAQLLPFMLIGVGVVMVALHWPRTIALRQQLVAALLVAAVVALPSLVLALRFPGEAMATTVTSWRTLLAILSGSAEQAAVYQQGRSILTLVVLLLFLFGMGMAVAHIRQMRYLVLLISVVVAIGGVLLLPTNSTVLAMVAVGLPAAMLLAARALVWIWKKLAAGGELGEHYALPALMLLVFIIVALDVTTYFGLSRTATFSRTRDDESGYRIAQYLNHLDGKWTAYLYGLPEHNTDYAAVGFLASQFDPAVNLFAGDTDADWLATATDRTVHIFAPEMKTAAEQLRDQIPDGAFLIYPDRDANPLFIVYEIGR